MAAHRGQSGLIGAPVAARKPRRWANLRDRGSTGSRMSLATPARPRLTSAPMPFHASARRRGAGGFNDITRSAHEVSSQNHRARRGARGERRRRFSGRRQGRADSRPHRPARSLRQADRDRLPARPRICHQRDDGGRRQKNRRRDQGRPGQARPRQERLDRGLRGRRRRHRRRHDLLARHHRHAAGRRGAQEDFDRRAGGGRPDHRRQVEPLHLPHGAQLLAGRDLERGRDRGARRQHRGARGRQRLRP